MLKVALQLRKADLQPMTIIETHRDSFIERFDTEICVNQLLKATCVVCCRLHVEVFWGEPRQQWEVVQQVRQMLAS
jgi:hypothetical protein